MTIDVCCSSVIQVLRYFSNTRFNGIKYITSLQPQFFLTKKIKTIPPCDCKHYVIKDKLLNAVSRGDS